MVKAPSHVAAIAVAAMPLISVCLAADSHSRVGYLSPDHKALARKAVAAARATGGRILEVQADGSGRYRTIQAAAAAAGAGDLVLVHPGMYRERLEITRGGKDGRPVVFKSVDVGVVIDGEKKRNCIVVRGDHVVVDGFECRNALLQKKHPDDGAICLWGAKGAVVQNCHCSGATDGHKVADISTTDAHGYVIRNNLCESDIAHSIDIAWQSEGGVVESNECRNSSSAIYVHAAADRTEVRFNRCIRLRDGEDKWHGSGIVCRDCREASIHHNVLVATRASGILIYDFVQGSGGNRTSAGANQPDENHRVCNNTCSRGKFGIEISGPVEGCIVRDNVVVGADTAGLRFYNVSMQIKSNRFLRNIYWRCPRPVESEPARALARGELIRADPLFIDPAADDYRTRRGSALVDAGDPNSAAPPRGGKRPDIGAYELLYEAGPDGSAKSTAAGMKNLVQAKPKDPLADHADTLAPAHELAKERKYSAAAKAFRAAAAILPEGEPRSSCAGLADAMQRNAALKDVILARSSEVIGVTAPVSVAGMRMRGRILSITKHVVEVQGRGLKAPLPWHDLPDSTFHRLASKAIPDEPLWHLRLAGFALDAGLNERAREGALKAMTDASLAAKAREIIESTK